MFTLFSLFAYLCLTSSLPTVLVQKEIITEPVGEGYDLKVAIHIHNIGEEEVTDVTVDDHWPVAFQVSPNSENNNTCKFDEIAAGENVTCEELFLPTVPGTVMVEPVTVRYTADGAQRTVYGEQPQEYRMTVFPKAAYARHFTSHIRSTFVFFLLAAFAVLLPDALYESTKAIRRLYKKRN